MKFFMKWNSISSSVFGALVKIWISSQEGYLEVWEKYGIRLKTKKYGVVVSFTLKCSTKLDNLNSFHLEDYLFPLGFSEFSVIITTTMKIKLVSSRVLVRMEH